MAITKKILISIQPQWVEKILNGEKTIEIRKTMPKCELPAKVYIYCTKQKPYLKDFKKYNDKYDANGIRFLKFDKQTNKNNTINGKVVAEFTLNRVEMFTVGSFGCDDLEKSACMKYSDFIDYFYKPEELDGSTIKWGYTWHIADLKIYDKPKELSEFKVFNKDVAEIGMFGWMFNEKELPKYIPLKRAPQSWQYVNHVEKEN